LVPDIALVSLRASCCTSLGRSCVGDLLPLQVRGPVALGAQIALQARGLCLGPVQPALGLGHGGGSSRVRQQVAQCQP